MSKLWRITRKTGFFQKSKNNLSVKSKKLLSVKKNFGKKCLKTKTKKIWVPANNLLNRGTHKFYFKGIFGKKC